MITKITAVLFLVVLQICNATIAPINKLRASDIHRKINSLVEKSDISKGGIWIPVSTHVHIFSDIPTNSKDFAPVKHQEIWEEFDLMEGPIPDDLSPKARSVIEKLRNEREHEQSRDRFGLS